MEYTTLGKTGLKVSRMGLGCGGHSRLGLGTGKSEADAVAIVKQALSLGVTFIDTAESYGTEVAVGKGIEGFARDQLVISTKAGIGWQDRNATRAEMRERVNACLTRLGTEWIDVFHLHGVRVENYAYGRDELVPELVKLKEEGKIRFIGITEAFGPDPRHQMLTPAVEDDCWEVVMVGFNILNQSARDRILETTQRKGIGTLCMFAVRRALSNPESLRKVVGELVEAGEVDRDAVDLADPLGFLEGSVTEAAYRFARHEAGLDVILSGTGDLQHLRENAASINAPPLPPATVERLRAIFGRVDSVSGN
ncbi:MAG: aldo/keto reductase [Fimbriimonas sp.]